MTNTIISKELTERKNNPFTWLVDVLMKHPEKILYAFFVITVLFMIFDI